MEGAQGEQIHSGPVHVLMLNPPDGVCVIQIYKMQSTLGVRSVLYMDCIVLRCACACSCLAIGTLRRGLLNI